MGWEAVFAGWSPIVRIAVVGAAAYIALVVMLRIAGKRTLSKLNAFDFVVTIALGSTLATVIISKDVALAEGLTALGLLIALQFAVTWTSVRWKAIDRLVKAEPTVLLRKGEPIPAAMRRERVAEGELLSAIRQSGGRELADAEVVLLESDGSLTALLCPQSPRLAAAEQVSGSSRRVQDEGGSPGTSTSGSPSTSRR